MVGKRKMAAACAVVAIAVGFAPAFAASTKLGGGGSMVQGSAGPDGAKGAAPQLQTCEKPLGSIAIAAYGCGVDDNVFHGLLK